MLLHFSLQYINNRLITYFFKSTTTIKSKVKISVPNLKLIDGTHLCCIPSLNYWNLSIPTLGIKPNARLSISTDGGRTTTEVRYGDSCSGETDSTSPIQAAVRLSKCTVGTPKSKCWLLFGVGITCRHRINWVMMARHLGYSRHSLLSHQFFTTMKTWWELPR